MFDTEDNDPLYFTHIAGRIIGRRWPELSLEVVWELFCRLLVSYAAPELPKLNAVVISPNSFHILLTERESLLSVLPEKIALGLEVLFEKQLKRKVPLFNECPEPFLITNVKDLRFVYRFIYQLPVREGLTTRAEDYPFSSLYYLLGRRCAQSPLLVTDTFGMKYEPEKTLRWINDLNHEREFWHLH